jgi:hypothetical protein
MLKLAVCLLIVVEEFHQEKVGRYSVPNSKIAEEFKRSIESNEHRIG